MSDVSPVAFDSLTPLVFLERTVRVFPEKIAVHYGERFTILKDRKKELGPGLYRKMLRAFEKYYETSALMTWRNKPCAISIQ